MTGFIGEKLQQIIDEGGAGGGGGGLPLYRHTINVYESANDTFEIYIQLISTRSEKISTEEQLKAILGTGALPSICTGQFTGRDGNIYEAAYISHNDNYYIGNAPNLAGSSIDLFSTDYSVNISDTVTAIDNASAAVTTLYRHDVLLQDGEDKVQISFTLLDAQETPYGTFDNVKNAVGIGKPITISGTWNVNTGAYNAYSMEFGESDWTITYDVNSQGILDYTEFDISVTDTVRPLASITVNGSGGGVVTDLGQQDGHLSAQNTIIELLKPDSVPQGSYIYSYWTDCAGNSALAIAYKCNSHIRCSQISSNGEIRKFTYEFSPENVIEQCFRPMGVELLQTTGDSQTAVMSQKAVTDALASAGGGSGIIDIDTQYVRITDLDSGIYRLTYAGKKYIRYRGATSASSLYINGINPIYLYVNKKQDSADGTAYWDWYYIGCTAVGNYVLSIYYGSATISDGQYDSVAPQTLVEIKDIINNLEESTYIARRALSAYQGYLLDQNKQNKTDETLETTDKTIVGAINELNGKSSTPKLYAPTIKISGLTLTIKNPTKNKDYVASYDIYNVDTNTLIRNTKKTTVDLESFNIADGTYNIAVKAKGIEFNGTPLYQESDYSNVLSYTHDNPPTLTIGTNWYKATVAKSTITEITFDNTYEVTGNETESWDASASRDGSVMCYLNGTSITIKPIHSTNKVHIRNCYYMFNTFASLIAINNLTALDTSNATAMYAMFNDCNALTSLDVSGFDTSNVTSMGSMFQDCNVLTTLDLSNFDTSNVTSMSYMFSGCNALTTLDVSGFDTGIVTNMSAMFQNCNVLTTLDLSNFDTSSVTNMNIMFQGCYALTSLDVSGFDTSNVTSMGYMFNGCNALTTLDVSGFDTGIVTNMSAMFRNCSVLTADCSSWDVDNVTSYSNFNTDAPNVIPPVWVN